ncbi:MAG: hypothetical protein KDA96_12605, partial [Planctomycetaceae bacterium]|nr:hypothetical protein [Planctomycetaceae bacterium]
VDMNSLPLDEARNGAQLAQPAPSDRSIPGRPASLPSIQNHVTPPAVQNASPELITERERHASETDRRNRQRQLIAARAGQTGFKGFCPVMLRDYRELVDADPQFQGTFGLQTYNFSSAQALAEFEVDPARYAPAAGGSDIVILVNSGEERSGLLDYALWYRDRLYLFSSRETMSEFSRDPRRFAHQY